MSTIAIKIRVRSTRPGGTVLPIPGSPIAPFVEWMAKEKWFVCDVDENELRVIRRKVDLDVEEIREPVVSATLASRASTETNDSPHSRRGRN